MLEKRRNVIRGLAVAGMLSTGRAAKWPTFIERSPAHLLVSTKGALARRGRRRAHGVRAWATRAREQSAKRRESAHRERDRLRVRARARTCSERPRTVLSASHGADIVRASMGDGSKSTGFAQQSAKRRESAPRRSSRARSATGSRTCSERPGSGERTSAPTSSRTRNRATAPERRGEWTRMPRSGPNSPTAATAENGGTRSSSEAQCGGEPREPADGGDRTRHSAGALRHDPVDVLPPSTERAGRRAAGNRLRPDAPRRPRPPGDALTDALDTGTRRTGIRLRRRHAADRRSAGERTDQAQADSGLRAAATGKRGGLYT